jgi:hypothetical protein
MVKRVLAELKMEVRSDIRAANITAIIIPLKNFENFAIQRGSRL